VNSFKSLKKTYPEHIIFDINIGLNWGNKCTGNIEAVYKSFEGIWRNKI